MPDRSLLPDDRQLLLAVRAAVAAGASALSGDREAAAMLASAEMALGVLLGRTDQASDPQTSAPSGMSMAELIAGEAAQAAACLAAPVAAADDAAPDAELLVAEIDAQLSGEGDTQMTSLKRLSGGFSRETIALDVMKGEESHALIVRRQKAGGLLEGMGMAVAQEYPLLRFVDAAGLPVGGPLWLEPEGRSVGGPYAVSQRVAGEGRGTPTGGTGIDPAHMQALAKILATLHSLDWQSEAGTLLPGFGLPSDPGSRADVVALYLDGWERYRSGHGVQMSPALVAVEQWLRDHIPADEAEPCLIHGDVGFHNLLFDGDQIAALLDWEMAYLGSPAKDLAQIHDVVSAHVPWESFLGWYAEAGGEAVTADEIGYHQILAGYTYLLVCEVARQAMLAQPAPNVAYVDLAFPIRAHFYNELHRAVSVHAPDALMSDTANH